MRLRPVCVIDDPASPSGSDEAEAKATHARRADFESLAAAASALAAALPAHDALLAQVEPLRALVADALALDADAARLSQLGEAAALRNAKADEGAARLAAARAAVRGVVAALTPAEVASALAAGTLPGLAERDAAEKALERMLYEACEAYNMLAAAQRARAALAMATARVAEGFPAQDAADACALAASAAAAVGAVDAAMRAVRAAQAASAACFAGQSAASPSRKRSCECRTPTWPRQQPLVFGGAETVSLSSERAWIGTLGAFIHS